jgi:hypothetical protein
MPCCAQAAILEAPGDGRMRGKVRQKRFEEFLVGRGAKTD